MTKKSKSKKSKPAKKTDKDIYAILYDDPDKDKPVIETQYTIPRLVNQIKFLALRGCHNFRLFKEIDNGIDLQFKIKVKG